VNTYANPPKLGGAVGKGLLHLSPYFAINNGRTPLLKLHRLFTK